MISSARKVEIRPVSATIEPALRIRNFRTMKVNRALRIAKIRTAQKKPGSTAFDT